MKNILYLIALLSFLAGCGRTENVDTGAEAHTEAEAFGLPEGYVELSKKQWETIGGQFATPGYRPVSGVVRASGKLDVPPQNLVTVTALIGGVVRNTKVLQGLLVKKGEVLATIDNPDLPDLQRRYAAASAETERLALELKRQTDLRRDEVNAAKTLEQVRADYKTAQANRQALRVQLQNLGLSPERVEQGRITSTYDIKAPITGHVSHIAINIGQRLNPSDPIFDIVNTEHLHAELYVQERDVFRLHLGQTIRFTMPSQGNRELQASVYLIGKTLEPDRTIRVHGHLSSEDHTLVPGLYLHAVIETGSEKALAVPQQALVREGARSYVFVYEGDSPEAGHAPGAKVGHSDDGVVFRRTEVKAGATSGAFIQVTPIDSLSDKSRIVTDGAFFVHSALKAAEGGGGGNEGHGH